MTKLSILQRGNIYFFYRPKIGHEEATSTEEAQRFMIALKPEKLNKYILLVVGKKHLPDEAGRSYFAFVEKVYHSLEELADDLKMQIYHTKTLGERHLASSCCLGQGKYMIISHYNHSDLIYKLVSPENLTNIQKSFNLKQDDEFIIQVKNPSVPSPKGLGLTSGQKAELPDKLSKLFSNHKFIPLNPIKFLNYEGIEILLNAKGKETIAEKDQEVEKCLEEIPQKDILQYLESIDSHFICGKST